MEKINVAELLSDCPRGMELDCTMYEDVYFDYVDELNIIHCHIKNKGFRTSITFNQRGTPNSDIKSKCVIFPKGKTTWQGFNRPFKDGDILADAHGNIAIYKGMMWYNKKLADYYCGYRKSDNHFLSGQNKKGGHFGLIEELHYANEEEKQKLFDAIKDNGYKWNAETKTLEKLLRFKVGDRIKHKDNNIYCTLGEYAKGISAYHTNIGLSITYKDMEQWELAPNKFDINSLVPFESRVLVRDTKEEKWKSNFWGFYDIDNAMNNPYECCGASFAQCIPYKGNEHLLGKTDDCDEFYKTW